MWILTHLMVAVIIRYCHADAFGALEDIDDGRVWMFRVEIRAGKSHCFYQQIRAGEIVNADFDSTGPDDSNEISISVTNENTGEVMYDIEGHTGDFYDASQTNSETGALYKFCLNNTVELESNYYKHVMVHFSAYLNGWGKYKEEIDKLDIQSSLFMMGIQRIQENIQNSTTIVYHSRARETRDFFLSESKNHRIMFWSTVSLVGIIASGLLQVYFIKNMFENTGNPDGSLKSLINKFIR